MQPYDQFAEKERLHLVGYVKAKYSFDDSRAEDVVQEALIQGLVRDQEGGFVSAEHRQAFVYQAARHRAIDEIRRANRQARTGADQQIGQLADPSETEIAEAQEFIAGYDVEEIRAAAANLRPRLYDILYLAFYEGLTNEEIARRLKLTYQQAAGRKHRALKRLRELLAGGQEQ